MTMTLVSTVQVGAGGAASIDFTSIPQTGTDLIVVISAKDTGGGGSIFLYFNGNSATANYSYRHLIGSGSAVSSTNYTGDAWYLVKNGMTKSTDTSSTFGNAIVYIANYAGNTTKSILSDEVSENNATAAFQTIGAGLWNQTAAISSITLLPSGSNFAQNSTASLYTITKGSGGATVS